MKKYHQEVRGNQLTSRGNIRRWVLVSVAWILACAPALKTAAQLPTAPVAITSIGPVGENAGDLLIRWAGGLAPFKLQVKNSIGEGWRDATFHIYTNFHVVSNSVEGAFYRVRTIPDQIPPESVRGFGSREVSCSRVQFTWTPSACLDPLCADNAGGTGFRGVRIYRDGVFLVETPFPGVEAVDLTVAPSTTYSYWATAVDRAGNESPRSGTRVVQTPSCNPEQPLPQNRSVTLAWDANPEPDIAGYVLRYGLASGVHTSSSNIENGTIGTVTNLTAGTRYYFVVAAYNTSGLEGDPSTEVFYTVP